MKKQILSEEFIRMQKLAGIQPVNEEKTLVLEGIKIFTNIFSSGLLTEAEIKVEDLTPEAIAFYTSLGITYENLDAEGKKLLDDLFKEAKEGKITQDDIKSLLKPSNVKEAEGEEENFQGGDSTIGKLRKYFEKNKVGKSIKNAIIGLTIAVITVPSIVNAAKLLSPKDVKTTVKTIKADTKNNADTGNSAYFPAEQAKINAEDVGVKISDNDLVVPFKLAKGDSAGLKDPKILDNFVKGLKAKYSDPSLSGKVTIKVKGYASNDSGTNSDKSSTSDKPLSEERPETIKNKIPEKIGNVDITVEIEKGNYNDLAKENPNSDNHIKGAVATVGIDDSGLKTTTTTPEEIPTELMNVYQPVKADYDSEPGGTSGTEDSTGNEGGEGGGQGGSSPSGGGAGGGIGGGTMSTDQVQKYLNYFPNLNRNGQLAVVLAAASPKTNIYNKLGLGQIKSFTDSELKAITQPEAKKIADLILNLRKNPNTLLNKLSTASGIQLAPRAKAVQTAPGQKYEPSSQLQKTIAEVLSLVESLNEAMVDTIFDELGISDSDLKKNRSSLLALVGSMYANAGNNTISILDPKDLTPEEQDKLKELGFSPQGAKGEYVFLQPDQTKASISFDKKQSQVKDKPDVTKIDVFLQKQPAITQRLNKVNSEKELAGVIQIFINQMAKQQPEKFGKSEQQLQIIQNLLNRLPAKIEEATTQSPVLPDVTNVGTVLNKNSTYTSLFKNINDIEEATQILLRIALKYVDPIIQNPAKIRTSINQAKANIEAVVKNTKNK